MSTRLIDRMDRFAAGVIESYSLPLMRWSLVMVLIWSGLLAIVHMNPGATLVAESIGMPVDVGVVILGVWEIVIGLGLASDRTAPLAAPLMIGYVAVTMVPLVVVPVVTFVMFPLVFTLEGAYIIKNWALLGGAITIGGLRG